MRPRHFFARAALLLALFALTTGLAFADDPHRLDPRVSPTRQEVSLKIDPSRVDFSGSTTIEVVASEAVDSFRLHARAMELSNLKLVGANGEVAVEHELLEEELGLVQISSATPLAPGDYSFVLIDSYGDGWHGGTYTVGRLSDGAILSSGGLSGGHGQLFNVLQ